MSLFDTAKSNVTNLRTLGLAAALTAVATAPLAAVAAPSDWRLADNGYSYGNADGRQFSGTIASVNGRTIQLENGRTLFLQNGTVILPTGEALRAGQRISFQGTNAGDGNFNARAITVSGYGNNNRGEGGYNDRYRDARDRQYQIREGQQDSAQQREYRIRVERQNQIRENGQDNAQLREAQIRAERERAAQNPRAQYREGQQDSAQARELRIREAQQRAAQIRKEHAENH